MKILFKAKFSTEHPQRSAVSTYRGNFVDFEAEIASYANPVELTTDQVSAFYQPLDGDYSDQLFAFENVEKSNNKIIAHWLPTYDVGAKKYRIWIEASSNGTAYPAMYEMEMLENPVFELSPTNPPAKKILDFSKFELVNAPWVETASFVESIEELEDQIDASTTSILDAIANKTIEIDLPTDYAKQTSLDTVSSNVSGLVVTTGNIYNIADNISRTQLPDIAVDVDQIKTDIAAIHIPTDYAKEVSLTSLSTSINNKIDTSSQTLAVGIDGVDSKIDDIDSAITTQTHTLENILLTKASQTSVNSIISSLGEVNYKASDIQNEIENLKQKVDDVETDLTAVRNSIDELVIPSDYATSSQAVQILTKLGEVDEALAQIIGG